MKNKFLKSVLCFLLVTIYSSCSTEQQPENDLSAKKNNQIENLKQSIGDENAQSLEFIESISFIYDGVELELFEFKTINANKSNYVAINKLTEEKEHLIFVDRDNFTIRIVNNDGEIRFDNIDKSNDYQISNGYDFIPFIKDLDENTINSRRFWGWSCGPTSNWPDGSCTAVCCYYIFWLENGCNVYSCTNLPGNQQQ